MADNTDGRAAREFHDRTTHTPASVRTNAHALEWDIKPFPFKVYTEAPAIPLPREFDSLAADTLGALGAQTFPAATRVTLADLAALLYHTAGVTKKMTYPGGGE